MNRRRARRGGSEVVAVDPRTPPKSERRDGDESVFDCEKAKQLLGWEPDRSWRDTVDSAGVVSRVPAFRL